MSSYNPPNPPTTSSIFLPQIFHLFSTGFGSSFFTHLAISCASSSLLLQLCKAQGALCCPLPRHLPIRGGIPLASRRRTASGCIGVVMVSMMFHGYGTWAWGVCTLLPKVHAPWASKLSWIFLYRKAKSGPKQLCGMWSPVVGWAWNSQPWLS